MKGVYILLSALLIIAALAPKRQTDGTPQEERVDQVETELRDESVLYIGEQAYESLPDSADLFCHGHMSLLDVEKLRLSDRGFSAMTLPELLAQREYERVVIGLGGSDQDRDKLICAYWSLLNLIIRTQPQAAIILIGSGDGQGGWNEMVKDLADDHRIFFTESI